MGWNFIPTPLSRLSTGATAFYMTGRAEQREMVDVGLLRPELALAWYFDLPCGSEAELKEVREKFMPK